MLQYAEINNWYWNKGRWYTSYNQKLESEQGTWMGQCFRPHDTVIWQVWVRSIWVIFNSWYFPRGLKKRQIIPVHKKESKNCLKNFRPISLLPIFSKIFERLFFNTLFNFFVQNQLFADCQSGFIPGNSCISQLLSISQEIHKSFECNPLEVVRGAFLDISKVFNKVCLEGLIFKLKTWCWRKIDYTLGNLLKKPKPKGSSNWS